MQRRSLGGTQEELNPSDNLIIIRVGKHQEDNGRWKMGGPLIADVDTALQNYPHKIFTLQVRGNVRQAGLHKRECK